jgi:hypothetical protein
MRMINWMCLSEDHATFVGLIFAFSRLAKSFQKHSGWTFGGEAC